MEKYKNVIKKANLTYQLQNGMKILTILWVIFCIRYSGLSWVYLKKIWKKTNNPSTRIYIYKKEKRITFKIKTGYNLELLTPETMKLFGIIESKSTKDKNVPHLEIIL